MALVPPASRRLVGAACTTGRWPAYLRIGMLRGMPTRRQGRRRYKHAPASVRQYRRKSLRFPDQT
ncbi:MAG TPA: hypothetical protein VF099_14105 [Ktedonobacterales bacterium]